jgi:hypothetical protein
MFPEPIAKKQKKLNTLIGQSFLSDENKNKYFDITEVKIDS